MGREKCIRAAKLLAASLLYAFAVFFCNQAGEEANLVHILLKQNLDAITAESIFAGEMVLEEPIGLCFWGEVPGQLVSCRATGAFTEVTQVLLSGNPEQMGAGILAWQDGCLIDEATARTLFGTSACGGQLLSHDGISYCVLGTVSALRPTMLTMAGETNGAALSRCVLSLPAEKGQIQGEQFLMRWGLQGTVLDFFPIYALTKNLLLLFPSILLFSLMGYLITDWRKLSLSEIRLRSLTKAALALLLAAASICFLGENLMIPQNMIPSRWSDFSFWGNWWKGQKENLLQLLMTPMGNRQLQMGLDMIKSIINSLAAALLALWPVRRRNNADTAD